MRKFKVIKQHYDLKPDTIVIDEGISEPETNMTGKEHRLVLIEGANLPITYIVPLEKMEELE